MTQENTLKCKVDVIGKYDRDLLLLGWAADFKHPNRKIEFKVLDQNGKPVDFQYRTSDRQDVANVYFSQIKMKRQLGFQIFIPNDESYTFTLVARCGFQKIKQTFLPGDIHDYFVENHLRDVAKWKEDAKNGNVRDDIFYDVWYELTAPKEEDLEKQRNRQWQVDAPLFSVVVPLYRTDVKYFNEMVNSVVHQTYGKWELCLADGSDERNLEKELKKNHPDEKRIRYAFLNENRGISGNSNAAMEMASGDYVVFLDHDDLLREDALYEMAEAIVKHPEAEYLYSDEDKTDIHTKYFFDPHFKPDFNPDLLRTTNYISHLSVVKKSVIDRVGMLKKEYDGAQDYDFVLRATENAKCVIHIPKVLYHWRVTEGSTAGNMSAKTWAFDAGARAVEAHWKRKYPELPVDHVEDSMHPGIYHTVFHFEEQPLVSVVIPNKDHVEDLSKLLKSFEKCTWKNLEFIIVENNSTDPDTFSYYEKIQKEDHRIHVIHYAGSFNYAAINNLGVKHAEGDYLLLLNNDMELIDPDSIQELAGYGMRKDVGIVGARLLYPDNTFQHAGVVIGVDGAADHLFRGLSTEDEKTYFDLGLETRDASAVTGACMFMRKEVYQDLSGFDDSFAVAYNDVDLCLRCIDSGKKVVYNPHASFYHYESKSRGSDFSEEKTERFIDENVRFIKKYSALIENGDPFFNVNFSHKRTDCALRNPYKEPYDENPFTEEKLIRMIRESTAINQENKR